MTIDIPEALSSMAVKYLGSHIFGKIISSLKFVLSCLQLACWEHYNPLARYAMMADGEQIHSAMYPGPIFGDLFAEQTEINIRQHALEAGCFVVSATAWLDADQQAQIVKDTVGNIVPISSGCPSCICALRSSSKAPNS